VITPLQRFVICGLQFHAFPIAHSLIAPAVGYRFESRAARVSMLLMLLIFAHNMKFSREPRSTSETGHPSSGPFYGQEAGPKSGMRPCGINWIGVTTRQSSGPSSLIVAHKSSGEVQWRQRGSLGQERGVDVLVAHDGMEITVAKDGLRIV
jgi:hypothetical protein